VIPLEIKREMLVATSRLFEDFFPQPKAMTTKKKPILQPNKDVEKVGRTIRNLLNLI